MSGMHKTGQETLRRLVEQIERLEEEKRGISEDIKDKFLEAKSTGFDVKILRKVIKLRKMDKTERDEADAILETYMHALEGTPLGDYAERVHGIAKAHGIPADVANEVIRENA